MATAQSTQPPQQSSTEPTVPQQTTLNTSTTDEPVTDDDVGGGDDIGGAIQNECENNGCSNGATCSIRDDNSQFCKCSNGYRGKWCEQAPLVNYETQFEFEQSECIRESLRDSITTSAEQIFKTNFNNINGVGQFMGFGSGPSISCNSGVGITG